jgi:hypothetical protein
VPPRQKVLPAMIDQGKPHEAHPAPHQDRLSENPATFRLIEGRVALAASQLLVITPTPHTTN